VCNECPTGCVQIISFFFFLSFFFYIEYIHLFIFITFVNCEIGRRSYRKAQKRKCCEWRFERLKMNPPSSLSFSPPLPLSLSIGKFFIPRLPVCSTHTRLHKCLPSIITLPFCLPEILENRVSKF
jgi:hypothetical protein